MITLVCEAIPGLANRSGDSAITQLRHVFIAISRLFAPSAHNLRYATSARTSALHVAGSKHQHQLSGLGWASFALEAP
jgi:hypothetical protein